MTRRGEVRLKQRRLECNLSTHPVSILQLPRILYLPSPGERAAVSALGLFS